MLSSSHPTRTSSPQPPRPSSFWLRAAVIAAVTAFASAGNAAGEVAALPAGTITPLTSTFTAVEGQSFSGIIATFIDSDIGVSAGNFTNVFVNWGDGSAISAGAAEKSGVNPSLFFLTGTHTYTEEGSFAPTVSFHDVQDNTDPSFSSSTATVDDAPLCVCTAVVPGSPTTFSGIGGTGTGGAALAAQFAFEASIGGTNNGGNPSPQLGGFRTLNWDGVKLDGTDFGGSTFVIDPNKTVGIPVNRFQERGVMFGRVYAVSNDGFADVNPGVAGHFTPFSGANDFAPFNTHEVDLRFVLASAHTTSAVSAATRGFGGIFINVHNATESSIEYFAGARSLGRFYVPVGPAPSPSYSFLGVLFNQPIVTRVHLTLGSGTIFRFDGSTFAAVSVDNSPVGAKVVALDDLAYAEPQPAALIPPVIITPTVNSPFNGIVGTFMDTDPNANVADFSATIDWGDGHTSPGQISPAGGGGWNVRGTNTYTSAGNFQITFTVQDFGGAQVAGRAEARLRLFLPITAR